MTSWIMARIKALCLDDPCSGNLRMVSHLAQDGITISHDRVHKFRRPMGLRAIHQKPHTTSGRSTRTLPLPGGSQQIPSVDQAWATDYTSIPLQNVSVCSWPCLISSPGMVSAGGHPTDLTRGSASRPWRGPWKVTVSQSFCTPISVVHEPRPVSWPDCTLKESSSAGRDEGVAATRSWLSTCRGLKP